MICNYFLPLHRFYFHFADGTHWYAVFFFDLVNLSIFAFVACGFEVIVTSNAMKAFSYVFLLVLDLTFSSLFHSELKFCIWCKVGRSSTLLFLMWISNFPKIICWKRCPFYTEWSRQLCQSYLTIFQGFISRLFILFHCFICHSHIVLITISLQ